MTDAATRLTQVQALYAASGRGNWAAAEEFLTDDFFAIEAPGLPFGGRYEGKGGLQALYGKVMSMIDATGFDFIDMTASGDHVVALLDIVLADPAGARLQVAEVFRFRGDQVCEIRPYYFDPAPVHAAVAAKAAKAEATA